MEDGYYTYKDDDLAMWRVLEIRNGSAFFFGFDYPFEVENLGIVIGSKIIMPRYES